MVLDCSVTMGWCFESEADEYTRAALLALARGEAVVPPVWLLEVVNVLLVAERRRRISHAAALRFLGLLGELPIRVAASVELTELTGLMALGSGHGLSAYDAAYLHVAMCERLPLATRDGALRTAVRAAGLRLFEAE